MDLFASTSLDLLEVSHPAAFHSPVLYGPTPYYRVDPPFLAWIERALAAASLAQSAQDDLQEAFGRFAELSAYATKRYGQTAWQAARESKAVYRLPAQADPDSMPILFIDQPSLPTVQPSPADLDDSDPALQTLLPFSRSTETAYGTVDSVLAIQPIAIGHVAAAVPDLPAEAAPSITPAQQILSATSAAPPPPPAPAPAAPPPPQRRGRAKRQPADEPGGLFG